MILYKTTPLKTGFYKTNVQDRTFYNAKEDIFLSDGEDVSEKVLWWTDSPPTPQDKASRYEELEKIYGKYRDQELSDKDFLWEVKKVLQGK